MSEKIPIRNFVMPDGGAICLNVVRKHGLYGVDGDESSVVMIKPNSIVEITVQEIPPPKIVKVADIQSLAEVTLYSSIPNTVKLAPVSSQSWHVWFGGKCPLPEGVLVEYVLRDKTQSVEPASNLSWSHDMTGCHPTLQIIAFRVAGLEDGYELEV